MPEPIDTETTVRVLLAAAGIEPSEEELKGFVQAYPVLRAGADSLYIEAVRYEEPALIFTPVPPVKP
jgi:hypothetical protein